MNSESEVPSLYAEKARVGTCRPLQGPRRHHSCAAALFVASYDGSLGLRVGSQVGHGRPGGLSLVCCSSPGPPAAGARFLGASGSFFRHGFAPSTGPARPGSLARCGEHATAAGPGSVPGPGGGRAENCHGPGSVTPEEREARLGEKMYARFQFDSTSLQRCARSCCTRLPVQPLAVTSLR